MSLELIEIEQEGGFDTSYPFPEELCAEVSAAYRELYRKAGFLKPWIGYFIAFDGRIVGTAGFKSPPADKRVEIAYFTFPGFEAQGIATQTAQALVSLAQSVDRELAITARTLPKKNASTSVLQKAGFHCTGTVHDPEDGEVWEWRYSEKNNA